MNPSTLLIRRVVPRVQTPFCQRRWAQVHDVRFFALHHPPHDRIQDRYRAKLEEKARERGYKDIEDLKGEYADKIQKLRKESLVPGLDSPLSSQAPPTPDKVDSAIPFQPPPPPQPEVDPATQKKKASKSDPPVRTLSSFIDVEKTAELPHKEIETIWRLRHIRDAQSLCALLQGDTFRRIAATARKHPHFILPLPREGQGAEIHFLQWTFPTETTVTVLFTHLAEFKLRGEFAQPHTTITYHTDLLNSKGVVLLEGRVMENKGVSVEEGQLLLMNLQKFYGFEALTEAARENKERRQKLLQQFSGGDESFKVEELLEEAERVP